MLVSSTKLAQRNTHTHTQRWTGISVTGSSKKLTDGSTPFPRYYSHDGPSPMKKPCTWKHMIICGAGHRWMVVAVASLLLKKACPACPSMCALHKQQRMSPVATLLLLESTTIIRKKPHKHTNDQMIHVCALVTRNERMTCCSAIHSNACLSSCS